MDGAAISTSDLTAAAIAISDLTSTAEHPSPVAKLLFEDNRCRNTGRDTSSGSAEAAPDFAKEELDFVARPNRKLARPRGLDVSSTSSTLGGGPNEITSPTCSRTRVPPDVKMRVPLMHVPLALQSSTSNIGWLLESVTPCTAWMMQWRRLMRGSTHTMSHEWCRPIDIAPLRNNCVTRACLEYRCVSCHTSSWPGPTAVDTAGASNAPLSLVSAPMSH
mmetsp:Transcript_88793/g.287005  ORF Transcript_88793/g.287005 Transcript_88793/m.287005 type:complete len:219 (+) Transcript_88793:703-1359(+)